MVATTSLIGIDEKAKKRLKLASSRTEKSMKDILSNMILKNIDEDGYLIDERNLEP